MNQKRNICAIILAAGRGSRMKSGDVNKVTMLIDDKPLISYGINLLQHLNITPIIIVIGHAKKSVQAALKNTKVEFIEQVSPLGTGHAALTGFAKVPSLATDVVILYGDDSYLYTKDILNKIINTHIIEDAAFTLLTIKVDNPQGLGRVVRDKSGKIQDIIEEKDATDEQKKLKEINPNCYIFKAEFLKKYLPEIDKSPVTGEYYLPALIKIAIAKNEKIKAIDGGYLPWKGINTRQELEEAKKLIKMIKK
jgi:bifunctional UDP-N-acetylglucosamine pyrophosphorylase/glucosamine-1-phosphate N-acetyltransferase